MKITDLKSTDAVSYTCTDTIVMKGSGQIAFIKGKTYLFRTSGKEYECDISELPNTHYFSKINSYFKEHFVLTDGVTPIVEKEDETQDDGIIESRGYRYKVEEEAISWDGNETPIGYCLDAEYFKPHQTTEFCNDNDCYKILASDDPELIDDGVEALPDLSPIPENNLLAEAVELLTDIEKIAKLFKWDESFSGRNVIYNKLIAFLTKYHEQK